MAKLMNAKGVPQTVVESLKMLKNKSDGKNVFKATKGAFIIQLLFMAFLCLWQILHGMFPSIEVILIITILMLIWGAQQRTLLRDLLPLFILLLTFQGLRGFADNLNLASVHVTDLIYYEKSLFSGTIPAYFLQSKLTSLQIGNFVSLLASIFYMSHFVVPVLLAIILWNKDKASYWGFVVGLLLLSYAGFVTYIFYPAAPPWWATQYGYLLDQPIYLSAYAMPSVIQFAGPNPVAAMPSLHMAYPTFVAAYSIYVWGKKVAWIVFLPICVGFSAVFLGHHYVVDIIAGAIYALFFFSLIPLWKKIQSAKSSEKIAS